MTKVLDVLIGRAERVSLWLAMLGGTMLFATVFLIMAEIVLRKVFSFALGLGFELSGYVLAISTSWALAYALFHKAHIRIDAAYVHFARPARVGLDLLALGLFVLFAVLVVDSTWEVAAESVTRGSMANTPLKTPLWIPQVLWAAGFAWFGLSMALLLVRVVAAVIGGDLEGVQRLIGSQTLDEQIKKESVSVEAPRT